MVQDAQLRELIDKYSNIIMFTGHTHWTFKSLQPVLSGKGKKANYVTAASVGYL